MQLLLGYLPPNPDDWDETLARRRTQYLMFCQVGRQKPTLKEKQV
jgi:hypothetical protein